jgi:hypothetical protein
MGVLVLLVRAAFSNRGDFIDPFELNPMILGELGPLCARLTPAASAGVVALARAEGPISFRLFAGTGASTIVGLFTAMLMGCRQEELITLLVTTPIAWLVASFAHRVLEDFCELHSFGTGATTRAR